MADYLGRGPETDYEVTMKDNGVFRKGKGYKGDAMTANQQLRLIYKTGTTDPSVPDDGGKTFRGGEA